MSETTTTAVAPEAATPVAKPTKPAPTRKPAPAKKPTPAKAPAPKSPTPKASANGKAPSTNGSEKSNRLLVFQALKRNPGGLTSSALRVKINMDPSHGQMGVILRGEIKAKRIRAEKHDEDGRDTIRYYLTAKGREHLEKGTIDSWAREKNLVALGRGGK